MKIRIYLIISLAFLALITCSQQKKIVDTGELFPVEQNGKYGFIDSTGKTVIAPQFDSAGLFSEGLARVQIGDKWGFIDKTGKMLGAK